MARQIHKCEDILPYVKSPKDVDTTCPANYTITPRWLSDQPKPDILSALTLAVIENAWPQLHLSLHHMQSLMPSAIHIWSLVYNPNQALNSLNLHRNLVGSASTISLQDPRSSLMVFYSQVDSQLNLQTLHSAPLGWTWAHQQFSKHKITLMKIAPEHDAGESGQHISIIGYHLDLATTHP
jgi:hypothetical protein